jgi:MFS transporter, ACS family, hexuronate transporter
VGLVSGAAFPGGLRTAIESLPPHRQGRGIALCYRGASLGSLITPFIVVPIALRYGWRMAFLATGAFGAAWLALWWRVARPPLLHSHRSSSLTFRWPNLMERRPWVVMSGFSLGAVALGVVANLSPLYLNRAMGLDQAQLGRVIWIPSVGWELGYFFWGWVADRWGIQRNQVRRVFCVLAVLALPLVIVTWVSSPWVSWRFSAGHCSSPMVSWSCRCGSAPASMGPTTLA